MINIELTIEGNPIPWERSGRARKGKKVWQYDSQKKEKELVRWQIRSKLRKMPVGTSDLPYNASYCVAFTFLLPPGDRLTEGKRNAKLWGLEQANEKPDYDNLEKFYLDCAKGLLWPDDKRIVEASSKKDYSENPRTIIKVMTKEELKVPDSVAKILHIIGPDKMREIARHVQELSYLDEDKIKENLGDSNQQRRGEWLAWTALLLARLAQSCAADLTQVAKVKNVEEQVSQMFGTTFFKDKFK